MRMVKLIKVGNFSPFTTFIGEYFPAQNCYKIDNYLNKCQSLYVYRLACKLHSIVVSYKEACL